MELDRNMEWMRCGAVTNFTFNLISFFHFSQFCFTMAADKLTFAQLATDLDAFAVEREWVSGRGLLWQSQTCIHDANPRISILPARSVR
jgi:hypothetical protein